MAVLDRAYASWKADQSRVLDRLLKDLSGKGHHAWVGANMIPVIAGGAFCCRMSVGTLGCFATTPDTVALSITGDIDVRVKIRPTKWAQPVSNGIVLAKDGTTTTNRSWSFGILSSRQAKLSWTPDGTSTAVIQSTVNLPAGWVDGETHWVRAALDVDNGAAGKTITFYWSDDYDVASGTGTWTVFATDTQAATTSIFDSTASVSIGADSGGGGGFDQFSGDILAYEIRNGINGTVVSAHDFMADIDGTARFLDRQNNLWTLNAQPGWITDDGFQGSSNGGPVYWDPTLDAYAGDVDVRVAFKGYATGLLGNTNDVSGRDNGGGKAGWRISAATGTLNRMVIRFVHTFANGTTTIDTSSGSIPGTDVLGWVQCWRVVLQPTNGLGGYTVSFYYKNTTAATAYADMIDHTGWTAIGVTTNTTAGTATNFSMPTTPYGVGWGGNPSSGAGFPGVFYAGGIWQNSTSSGNPYMAVDLHGATVGAHRIKDAWGKEWTLRQGGGTSNDPQLLVKESYDPTCVYLPGVTGNSVSTPNNVAFNPADLDVRALVAPDLWSSGTNQVLASVWGAAGNQGWQFLIDSSNRLSLGATHDGTTQLTAFTTALPFSFASSVWVRVTRIGSTGAVAFYWSLDYNPVTNTGTWTAFTGITNNITSGALFGSTAALIVGGNAIPNSPLTGRVMYFELHNGVDGPVVATFNPSGMAATDTSYTGPAGNVWTINRSASGRKSVVVDRTKWLAGTDDYFEAMDSADFNAVATDSITGSFVGTHWNMTSTSASGILMKRDASVGTSAGWGVAKSSTASNVSASVNDGTNQAVDLESSGVVSGALQMWSVRKNAQVDVSAVVDSTFTATAATTVGSTTNTNTVRLFRMAGTGTNYSDLEFYGAAFFREALIAADLTSLKTELLSTGGGPVTQTVTPTGIASVNAFGNPSFTSVASISPAGVGSAQLFGQPVVTSLARVSPVGVGSLQALGLPSLSSIARISPAGIGSQQAFGTALLKAAAQISPAGLASAEVFGLARILSAGVVIQPLGIGSAQAFGLPVLHTSRRLDLTGISSVEAFGLPVLHTVNSVFPQGIPSAEAVGIARIRLFVVVVGISTAEVFGTPKVNVGVLDFFVLPKQMYETGLVTLSEASPALVRLGGIMEMERRWP